MKRGRTPVVAPKRPPLQVRAIATDEPIDAPAWINAYVDAILALEGWHVAPHAVAKAG